MKKIILASVILGLALPLSAMADVPVVNASDVPADVNANLNTASDSATNPNLQQMSPEERIARLEQQVAYLQQLNVPSKITQLQQTVQDMRGLLEVQGHQIQQLEIQQRNLYGDLDKRLAKLSGERPVPLPKVAANDQTNGKNQVQQSADAKKETQMYQDAYTLIKNKKYSDAIQFLNIYLSKYPSGKYAANAHYWLGELYTIAGQNDKARDQLTMVVNGYSDSEKVPDAMLKLGWMAYDNSQWDQAKQWWQTILKKYPDSSAAQLAKSRLQQLQQSGH